MPPKNPEIWSKTSPSGYTDAELEKAGRAYCNAPNMAGPYYGQQSSEFRQCIDSQKISCGLDTEHPMCMAGDKLPPRTPPKPAPQPASKGRSPGKHI